MTNTASAQNIDVPEEDSVASTGLWCLTPDAAPPKQMNWAALGCTAVQLVGAASSLTFGSDPWIQLREIPMSVATPFQPVAPRRISLAEARRIALQILADAEAERLQAASEEAARGVDWEHGV